MPPAMHYYGTFEESALREHPTFAGHADGYAQVDLVSRATGSMHTGLSIAELAANGVLHPHVHAYEEGFYILSGEAVVVISGVAYHLGPGDFGAVKVGTPHAVRAVGGRPVRWMQMAAPQPKPQGAERDTFFARDRAAFSKDGTPLGAPRLDLNDLQGNLLGHFDASMIPPVGERQNVGPGLEGVFLKWLIDEAFGARHHRMLFIEYQPGVRLGLHDHTFEEGYFILEGEVEATVDGKTYLAKPGDVVWTAVGCVHGFANVGTVPVRWLETFAPQPPQENVFRFMAEWEKRAKEIEG
jgi:mannose-6-phosphate isomerase-like protein (cupin superfamily)